MPRGDILTQRLLGRIREAEDAGNVLTVVYPPVRPIASGATPGTAPVSPLTGPAPATTILPPTPDLEADAVTLGCLWYDSVSSVETSLGRDRTSINRVGWMAGAQALAQVRINDAAVDSSNYGGDTVFTNCEAVVFRGHRYRVLGVAPVGAGHRVPSVYYVWLVGAAKQ